MQKILIVQIVRLWGILALIIIIILFTGRLSQNRTLFYLETTRGDLQNTIWMLDTVRGIQFPIIQHRDLMTFDLAHDGNTIVYQVGFGETTELFFLGVAHHQHERIAAPYIECPKWSPDDKTLIYQNYDDYSLYLLDVASFESRLLLFLGSGIARCSYDWTPSGTSLIHTDWPRPSALGARIVHTNIDTGESTILIGTGRPVRQLNVAPDGVTITYNSQSYAGMMNIETLASNNISYYAYTFAAAYSPTQEYLAFGYQKPLLQVQDEILRGLAVIDANGTIIFQSDVGTISHISWWGTP